VKLLRISLFAFFSQKKGAGPFLFCPQWGAERITARIVFATVLIVGGVVTLSLAR